MNGLSPWALSASSELAESQTELYRKVAGSFEFKVYQTTDSIWIVAQLPNGGSAAFRAAFSPGGKLDVKKAVDTSRGIHLEISNRSASNGHIKTFRYLLNDISLSQRFNRWPK